MYYMSREFNNAVTEKPLLLWNNPRQVEGSRIGSSARIQEQLGNTDGTDKERLRKRIGRRLRGKW